MPLRFGINGFGRIGRALLRIAHGNPALEVAAVNDVVPAPVLARLLARDTVHGPFGVPVAGEDGALVVGGRRIPVFAEPDPARVPWERRGGGGGRRGDRAVPRPGRAAGHLGGPCASSSSPPTPTRPTRRTRRSVLGLNEEGLDLARHAVVSNASCTTYCLALVAKVLHEAFGVRRALMSTVHSYTENQRLLDLPHPDPRRSRAAAQNIIPTGTTATEARGAPAAGA